MHNHTAPDWEIINKKIMALPCMIATDNSYTMGEGTSGTTYIKCMSDHKPLAGRNCAALAEHIVRNGGQVHWTHPRTISVNTEQLMYVLHIEVAKANVTVLPVVKRSY